MSGSSLDSLTLEIRRLIYGEVIKGDPITTVTLSSSRPSGRKYNAETSWSGIMRACRQIAAEFKVELASGEIKLDTKLEVCNKSKLPPRGFSPDYNAIIASQSLTSRQSTGFLHIGTFPSQDFKLRFTGDLFWQCKVKRDTSEIHLTPSPHLVVFQYRRPRRNPRSKKVLLSLPSLPRTKRQRPGHRGPARLATCCLRD